MQFRHASVIRHHARPTELCIGATKTGGQYLAVDVSRARIHHHVTASRRVAQTIKRRKQVVQGSTQPATIDAAVEAIMVANQALLPLNELCFPVVPPTQLASCALAYVEPLNDRYATFRSVGGCSLMVISGGSAVEIDFPDDPGVLTGRPHIPAASKPIRLPIKAGDKVILGTPTARPLMGAEGFVSSATRSPSALRRWLKTQALPPAFGVSMIHVSA